MPSYYLGVHEEVIFPSGICMRRLACLQPGPLRIEYAPKAVSLTCHLNHAGMVRFGQCMLKSPDRHPTASATEVQPSAFSNCTNSSLMRFTKPGPS